VQKQGMAVMNPLPTSRLNVLCFSNGATLLWTRYHGDFEGEVSVTRDGASLPSSAGYFSANNIPYLVAFAQGDALSPDDSAEFEILHQKQRVAFHTGAPDTQEAPQRFLHFFSSMSGAEKTALFLWLLNHASQHGSGEDSAFHQYCLHLGEQVDAPLFHVTHSYRLDSNAFYSEGEAQDFHPEGELQIAYLSEHALYIAPASYQRLSETRYALFALFPENAAFPPEVPAQFFCLSEGKPLRLHGVIPTLTPTQEMIRALNGRPPHEKRNLQDMLCRTLLESTSAGQAESTRELIEALQCYLEFPPTHCTAPHDPFNINFEVIFPLGSEGIFLCGWMRDPYHMLESIDIHTLGYHFPLGNNLFRIKRPDVTQAFLDTPHGGFEEEAGFIAFAPLPQKLSALLETRGLGLHCVHFSVRLRGGITYDIQPELRFKDARAARDAVLKIIPAGDVSEAMLTECLGPAASILQREAMRDVEVSAVYAMESQIEKPRISLVIPLYKRLDFIKVQFATLASDPALRECEIIYVLDSPWQEAQVRDMLREYAHLYQLPVSLIVMRHNSGYAAASNTGAEAARGEFIVLMNSDVFPAHKGWTKRMADFYASKKKSIGALAPKLLYEDDSLQHAGMFFAKTTFPDWINLHYYKGYPRHYHPASITRPVPAVTGACLMISRELWTELEGLSVEYVVGDFEDSDLCLKCAEAGRENWYFAEAELYHLERQSVPLNESYTEGLAWRYNARLHTQRWNRLIAQLMETYGDA